MKNLRTDPAADRQQIAEALEKVVIFGDEAEARERLPFLESFLTNLITFNPETILPHFGDDAVMELASFNLTFKGKPDIGGFYGLCGSLLTDLEFQRAPTLFVSADRIVFHLYNQYTVEQENPWLPKGSRVTELCTQVLELENDKIQRLTDTTVLSY